MMVFDDLVIDLFLTKLPQNAKQLKDKCLEKKTLF